MKWYVSMFVLLICGMLTVGVSECPPSVQITYIYANGDDTQAQEFKSFLEARGYALEMYDVSEVDSSADFTHTDLFIVDNLAGRYSWDATNSVVLTGSGKPIIGIGAGVYVFEFLYQYLDGGKCGQTPNELKVVPHNLAHDLWNVPNDLNATDHDPIELAYVTATVTSLHDDGSIPLGVEFLGESWISPGYFTIAVQDTKYALWGYNQPVSKYSNAGLELFVNLVEYVRTGSQQIPGARQPLRANPGCSEITSRG